MKFSEMTYEHIDISEVCGQFDKVTAALAGAQSLDDAMAAIDGREKLTSRYYTMETLAQIRHTIDTSDELYDKEVEYYDDTEPLFAEKSQAFTLELLKTPLRAQLEAKYGKLLFVNAEMQVKTFSPQIIDLLREENKLTTAYEKLVASAKIEFDGKVLNISQLSAYKQNPSRDVRRGAYEAEGNFYMSHKAELDDVFDKLVKCRTAAAKQLGFKSFTELAYLRLTRNCYDAAMVGEFRKQVIKDIVPLVGTLKQLQRKRIGVDSLKFYDDVFCYKEGNPKPHGEPEDIVAAGKKMYEEMSSDTGEFINFMLDNELMDLVAKPNKAVGGYCTNIPDYKSPFIFSNFNGTSGDVDVLTHEAGHAFAAYEAYKNPDILLLEQGAPTMESCEVHSMSMEFFAWRWHELFYGDGAARSRFAHLESCVTFIPYGTMVDDFQHIMYDEPDLTPAQRDEKWAQLEKLYRPYIDFDNLPFYSQGAGWQRQLHIYECPFYYIDYCFAQTMALNFWALSQADYADAFSRYRSFVSCAGLKTFTGLCEAAGLKTPFEPGCLKAVADTAAKWLAEQS